MASENGHELSSADVSLDASGSNGLFTNGQGERLRVQPLSLEIELEPRARAKAGGAKQAQHGPSGEWYHSAFHTVTAVVGAGVLGLPFALSFLGWTAGMFCLVFSLIVSFYTSYLLASLHEQPDGTRYNTYRALGRKLLGNRAGLWAIVPFQSIVMVGLGITYLVTAGQSLKYVQDANRSGDDPGPLSLTAWIGVFSVLQLFLSQLPDFHSLWWVSLIGAAMSCFYTSIAAAASTAESEVEEVSYSIRGESMADKVFGVLNALGTITFAYGGHSVLLEIQATLRSPPRTLRPMMNGVVAAYIVVFLAYFSVAITGYYRFGNQVKADVLLSVSHPVWLVSLANMMVVVHVAASYQIYSQPIFAVIEEAIAAAGWRLKPLAVRLAWRSAYVGMTCFMAMTFPFFGDLMGLAGALGFTPMTFVVPSVLWLRASPRPWWDVCINASIIALFSFVGVIAAVGALRLIIVEASSYDFYS